MTYPNGTVLTITKEQNGWGYTGLGWVSLDYVEKISTKVTEMEDEDMDKAQFSKLFTEMRNGSRNLVGKCAIYHAQEEPVAYNDHIIRVRLNSLCNGAYLYWYLQSQLAKDEITLRVKTSAGQYTISGDDLREMRVPLPPLKEQKHIADYLDNICTKIDRLIDRKVCVIDKLTAYKKSLTYEVVTGKREIDADLSAVTSVVVLTPALIAELREKRAALMTRFIDGLGDENKGRTEIQKCMSLAEGLIDLQLGIQFVRQHYGPYDEDIHTYEQIMADHEWVNHAKKKGHIQYTHGKKFQEYHSVYRHFFGNYDREIQRIIDFVKPIKRTSEIGRMATLFAAWNDFILDGIPNPTDEQIISEVRSNWTDNKANTPVDTWQDSLNKLRAAGMVPCGYGRHTVKLEEGDRTHG